MIDSLTSPTGKILAGAGVAAVPAYASNPPDLHNTLTGQLIAGLIPLFCSLITHLVLNYLKSKSNGNSKESAESANIGSK